MSTFQVSSVATILELEPRRGFGTDALGIADPSRQIPYTKQS